MDVSMKSNNFESLNIHSFEEEIHRFNAFCYRYRWAAIFPL